MHGHRPRPLALRLLGYGAPRAVEAARGAASRLRALAGRRGGAAAPPGRAFDAAELAAHLRGLGIAPGDLLLVHSSMDALGGFQGPPTALVRLLSDLVGPQGTLCMPAEPARPGPGGQAFDVLRTPSASGLLSECFRRLPGARRSMQERSVAAVGPLAETLTATHHACLKASGPGSPWALLAEMGGKVLCLGLPAVTNTLFHCGEDLAPEAFPADLYGPTPRINTWRDASGAEREVPVLLRRAKWVQSVDAAPLLALFDEREIVHADFAGLPCSLTQAGPFVERLLDLARQGAHMYGLRQPRAVPRAEAPAHGGAG